MKTLTLLSVALLTAQSLLAAPKNVPKGFATTNGQTFEVDGKPFAFVGANSYWLPLLTSAEDVDSTFAQMANAGVKVLRTWGFNAINDSELAGALASGLTFYQVWNSSEWSLNDGPQGLQRLDHVIETAGKYDIKVILPFTNNWVGYGGAELYINWIAGEGSTHDVFYTDPRIIASYQKYVETIVSRYKNSPNIFAWELMNEARCSGDLPSGLNCSPGTGLITKWYKEQSDFIRSLDPFHMITTGGEGQFFFTNSTDYNYDGEAGEDFNDELGALDNIDFGTYHLYPQYWETQIDFPGSNETVVDWGVNWITQHAEFAKRANKPVVLEEFGLTGLANQTTGYQKWVERALETKTAGIMPWQFGALGLKEAGGNRLIKYADMILNGASPNDGFAIYRNESTVWNIFTRAAAIQASRSN